MSAGGAATRSALAPRGARPPALGSLRSPRPRHRRRHLDAAHRRRGRSRGTPWTRSRPSPSRPDFRPAAGARCSTSSRPSRGTRDGRRSGTAARTRRSSSSGASPSRSASSPPDPASILVARFLADAEATFARGAAEEAPVDWIPAPHERRRPLGDGLVVQLRDGVERIAWQGRTYHRTECQGLRRREHRVVRVVDAGGRSAALRGVARGARRGGGGPPGARRSGRAPRAATSPFPTPGARDASGRTVARGARRAPAARGDAAPRRERSSAVWPGSRSCGDRSPAISSTRGPRCSGCRRSSRASTEPRGPALRPAARRALAQQLVREVLGLIGPAVRDAAAAWLAAIPRRDRRRSWRQPRAATASRSRRPRSSPWAGCWTPSRPARRYRRDPVPRDAPRRPASRAA